MNPQQTLSSKVARRRRLQCAASSFFALVPQNPTTEDARKRQAPQKLEDARKRLEAMRRFREEEQRKLEDARKAQAVHLLSDALLTDPKVLEEQAYIWQQLQIQQQADTIQRRRQEQRSRHGSTSDLPWSFVPSFSPGTSSGVPRPSPKATQATQPPPSFSASSSDRSTKPTPAASTNSSTSPRSPNGTHPPKPATFVPPQGKSRSGSFNAGAFPSGTSPHIIPGAEEWQHRHNEFSNEQQVPSRLAQEKIEADLQMRSAGKPLSREDMVKVLERHERLWSQLPRKSNLSWADFPWPMAVPPTTPDDISSAMIWAYLHSPCWPDTETYKDRIKDHAEKWRLEHFETKFLIGKVGQNERAKVIRGVGNVVRHLSNFLRKDDIGSLEVWDSGQVEKDTYSEEEAMHARELEIVKKEDIRRKEQELQVKERDVGRHSEGGRRLKEEFEQTKAEATHMTLEAARGMAEELAKKESEWTWTKSELAKNVSELAKRDSVLEKKELELAEKESNLEAREKAMVQREQDAKKVVDNANRLVGELAQAKEIETKKLEKDVQRKATEVNNMEQKANLKISEARRIEEHAKNLDDQAKRRITELEKDLERKFTGAKKIEESGGQKDTEMRGKEEAVRKREERLQQEFAKARQMWQEAQMLVQETNDKNDKLLQFEEDLLAREKELRRREEKARYSGSSTVDDISMQYTITSTSTKPPSILSSGNISISDREQFFQEYQQHTTSKKLAGVPSTKSSVISVTDGEAFYQEQLQLLTDPSPLHFGIQQSDDADQMQMATLSRHPAFHTISGTRAQVFNVQPRDTATPRPHYGDRPVPCLAVVHR